MYNISMIIDIVIAAVILIGIIIGLVRGFIKTVFGFFHSIASGVAAYFCTPIVTGYIKSTVFYKNIVSKTEASFYETVKNFLESDPEKILPQTEEISAFFERFGKTSDFIKTEYERLEAGKISDAANAVTEYIVSPACSALLTVLTFLVLFGVAFLLLRFVMKIFDGMTKLPVLHGINMLLGAVLGGIIGCAIVFLVITVFEAALPFVAGTQNTLTIQSIAEGSYLYRIFTAVNPFGLLFVLIA